MKPIKVFYSFYEPWFCGPQCTVKIKKVDNLVKYLLAFTSVILCSRNYINLLYKFYKLLSENLEFFCLFALKLDNESLVLSII